ncbi:MAG TPA: NAD-dependent epimerase [Oligoflexus sp.]|uniref:NAD-dependent epimerase n=1 Tax=Oligoflexus sp. TaxID=1971216 RepID=UPI002D579ED4|nr:NAD-dependent epimerase [Oligoflexus sp.]HYX35070.1 NAD-dependent epimerase [Oligoflexus sp.]
MERILVTGAGGFIGYHVAEKFLAQGHSVLGYDNMNDYYDVKLKNARIRLLQQRSGFSFIKNDINNREAINEVVADYKPRFIVHLAAQPGVRYSLENPSAYIDSNISGFLNILETCRHHKIEHLVYASSSSVYGLNAAQPFSVKDNVDHPASLYAATKKSNELMAHAYSHLFKIPTTGLRFFTVYGPWGRPDMAYFLFAKAILEKKPINIFNFGRMSRDFTYIDDIVQGVSKVLFNIPEPDLNWKDREHSTATSSAPYRIYNIGNNQPVELLKLVELLEQELEIPAQKILLPMQPGDVESTFADIDDLNEAVGFEPTTSIEIGIKKFVDWFKFYSSQQISMRVDKEPPTLDV